MGFIEYLHQSSMSYDPSEISLICSRNIDDDDDDDHQCLMFFGNGDNVFFVSGFIDK